jgi:hypothetical protein
MAEKENEKEINKDSSHDNNPKNIDSKEGKNKEGENISNNKITIQEFVQKERISPWAAKVFIKTLDDEEYSETILKRKYKKFVEEGKVEEVKK